MPAEKPLVKTPKLASMRGAMAWLAKKEMIEEAAKVGPLHALAVKREVTGAMAAVESRSKDAAPLSISGMEFIESGVLKLSDELDTLEVDDRYQRGEQKSIVNPMALALIRGGRSLAPVVLVKRGWKDDQTRAGGMRYILDGQQRILAHISAGVDEVPYVLYRSASLDAEKRAFAILNTASRRVSGNEIVRSIGGPACSLIRQADESLDHPLHGRIQWHAQGHTTVTGNIGALMTLKGMAFAVGIISPTSKSLVPAAIVPKLDAKFDRRKADAFLRVLAQSVPVGQNKRAVMSFVLALGQVCAEKWNSSTPSSPKPAQCAQLARVDWLRTCRHSLSLEMLPVVRERIKGIWK